MICVHSVPRHSSLLGSGGRPGGLVGVYLSTLLLFTLIIRGEAAPETKSSADLRGPR